MMPGRAHAEAARIEDEADAVRVEQKRLVALLAERGATPEGASPGMLRAFLST